jgi:SpoIID/LytB domain protein
MQAWGIMKYFTLALSLFFAIPARAQTVLQKVIVTESEETTKIELQADQPLEYERTDTKKPPILSLLFRNTTLLKKAKSAIDNGTIRSSIWDATGPNLSLQLELEVETQSIITSSQDRKTLTLEIKKQQAAEAPPELRVAVLYRVKKAELSGDGDFTLTNQETGETLTDSKKIYKLSTKKGKLILSNHKGKNLWSTTSILLTTKDPSKSKISTQKTLYRGSLLAAINEDGTFTVINTLDLESYLYGVVPREMPASWPKEALAAQAVAARTYAMSRLGQFEAEGFDVFDTTKDQVYGGASAEHKNSTAAVELTRGVGAVDLDGARVNALYFSTAGGCTEDNDAVFEEDPLPYLRSVKTTWDAESPNFSWALSLTKAELEGKLNKNPASKIGELSTITLRGKTTAGRWTWVELEGSLGTKTLRGHQFRKTLGASRLKSTLFTMTEADDVYTFDGKGYGHGVGMCQYSAKGMAAAGYTHRQILRTFYGDPMRLKVEY